jgi:hypothetical protein
MNVDAAVKILKAETTGQRRYVDVIYGPSAALLRQRIACALHEKPLTKSAKECQYGDLRRTLIEALGVSGNCIAREDKELQRIIETRTCTGEA